MKRYTKASFSPEPNERERENLLLAYEAACEGIVLLKNDGTLPLQNKKVALYGAGASMTVKGGTGSGEVNERHSVTVLEGMENRGFEIATGRWLESFDQMYAEASEQMKEKRKRKFDLLHLKDMLEVTFESCNLVVDKAVTQADVRESDTDTCVYVLSRQAGEGGDRKLEKGDYLISDTEREAITFCASQYTHFVLIINSGSSVDMSFVQEIPGINSIVYMCQLGTQGGNAVADILLGSVTPSGKLTDTWAKQYADIPFADQYSYLNGDLKQEYYREGIYVGYRYFDSFGVEPAYPFGFGLSYTDFRVMPLDISAEGADICIKLTVTNTGEKFSGKEVAQLYVSVPSGELHREYQSLVAFGKTDELAPGESREMELHFSMEQLAGYREADACYILEPGDYILRLGTSSRHTQIIGKVAVDRQLLVSRHKNICPVLQPIEELKSQNRPEAAEVPTICLKSDAIKTKVHSYEVPSACMDVRVKAFVESLSVKQMARMVVGANGEKAWFDLPGSVGNTTSKFWKRGLVNVALCDGPAGLRLQKRSTLSRSGRIKPVDMAMSAYESFPDIVKKFMLGNPQKETVIYQYTTAFPVANALAQSWNTRLMYRIGKAVYREMKEYGCTYWLAPAINIHRNPLCGRNYEYFSEDPLLAGHMAAAMTKGVQQEPGFYVTVKHFACNNQEDNRTYMCSNLSERTLREIYLRAFEWTVRTGGAKSVMTSYNKINGVYTPNSHDLCTAVLRSEWGFDGVVMTDWDATGGTKADTALALKVGNDLIMPGGRHLQKEIVAAVKEGRISKEDLYRCCCNVVKSIFDSDIQRKYGKGGVL